MAGPSSSGSSSPITSPVTPATNSSASRNSYRRSNYRVEVPLLSARTSVVDFRSSYISAAGSTTSTTFSGVGAITGRFLHTLGGRTVHGIEYLIKIRPALKKHKDALLGKRILSESEISQIVDDLLEISKADYLRTYRKDALETLVACGGRELWVKLDEESRRCVRMGLLDISKTSMLTAKDERFAHELLEKCVRWDLQIANEEGGYDLTDIQRFSNDIREYASRSRKDWAYELLHDIFERVQLSDWYSDEQRNKLCLELLDMSIQERKMARMTWAVESLLNYLHLPGWDGCLTRLDMEVLCSALYALAQKDDSKAGEKRAWALYHLWEFARLPSWQSSRSAIFDAGKWREVITWMLNVARKAPRDQQKRAFETLTEFLELNAVGDPLHKVEKQQICKELLSFSKHAKSPKEKQWAFSLMLELMLLRTWDRLSVKVHRVLNQERERSSAGSPWRSRSQHSADIFQSLADVGMRRRSDTNSSRPSLMSKSSSSGNFASGESSSSLLDDGFVHIHITPANSRDDWSTQSAATGVSWSHSVAKAGRPPTRLYASDWTVDTDLLVDLESAGPNELGSRKVILKVPITESPASIRDTRPLPQLSPTSSSISGHFPPPWAHKEYARYSPGSLQVPSSWPMGSPITSGSSISSSSPPRAVYTNELRGSPSSLLTTQSLPLPPTSPVSSGPSSPRIPSPSTSESSYTRTIRSPPQAPAPASPLPPTPDQQVSHRRGSSVELSPRPPPRSPLPPTPLERATSESQAPPSTFSLYQSQTPTTRRPATAPQITDANARWQRNLSSVREESRTRPRGDSFLEFG